MPTYEPSINFTLRSNLQKAKHYLAEIAIKNRKKLEESTKQNNEGHIVEEMLKGLAGDHF